MIHAPDVESIPFLLRLLTASKQAVIFDIEVDQTRSMVTIRREDLTISYLVNCILDVALSVAASVVASLLLLSGDIEQNPGPGKELCCHYCSTIMFVLLVQILTITVSMLLKYYVSHIVN